MIKSKKIMAIYFLIMVFWMGSIIVFSNECSGNSLVDPTVEVISIGPKEEYGIGEGYKFMVILAVSEIYYHVYIQEITFGEEGCCKKIKRFFQIKDKDLSGDFEIKSFEDIKWLSPRSFIITLNESERFIIKDLDKAQYKVEKVESYKDR